MLRCSRWLQRLKHLIPAQVAEIKGQELDNLFSLSDDEAPQSKKLSKLIRAKKIRDEDDDVDRAEGAAGNIIVSKR